MRPRRLPRLAVAALLLSTVAAARSDLESDFRDPPASAKPLVWWHWMNGNVTREGITADLEAMKRVGLAGATIFDVWEKIPAGPVPYGSAEWRRMIVFAVQEADRLGLELSIHVCPGWSSSGGPWITPELAMQRIVASEVQVVGPQSYSNVLPKPETRLDFYRDVAVLAFPTGSVVDRATLVDLAGEVQEDGRLIWNVPPGTWTILRIGHTPTGAENQSAPESGRGLECDKLSRAGIDAHWAGAIAPILEELGPLAGQGAGKVLRGCLLDSYEVGDQNWTEGMREQFRARRGYDPILYLPALVGHTVERPEVSERFRWDLRRTVADLFASEYHERFAELCRASGLESTIEAYEGPFDSLLSGAAADVPMGEFWVDGKDERWCELAASIAHVQGKRIVAAEAFTADPKLGRWQEHPFLLKAVGDRMYCAGINRFAVHRFAHQPWLDKFPGMTMGQWGIHFERTTTWWDQGAAWVRYLSRCQAMLQRGLPVADLCVLVGEGAPETGRIDAAAIPPGYDADAIGADVLLGRVSVQDGNLVLPDGTRYRALVLADSKERTPALLAKLRDLVQQGATIVGKPPTRSPSLADLPAGDERVRALAREIWGRADGAETRVHTLGKGRAFFGPSVTEVLEFVGVAPDFEIASPSAIPPKTPPDPRTVDEDPPPELRWIHRVDDGADVYFVSNQEPSGVEARCSFRVSGKRPELWHPDTGEIEPAPIWRAAGDRTEVTLRLDPSGSVFVVFREPWEGIDPVVAITGKDWEVSASADGALELRAFESSLFSVRRASGKTRNVVIASIPPPLVIPGPWRLTFPLGRGAPREVELEELISWPDHPDPGVRYFSGTATYTTEFELAPESIARNRIVRLDLGRVECVAEVALNGIDLGTWWKPPFAADITSAAKAGKNRLEVRVTNLWANRLIGDEQLPDDGEWVGKQLKGWPAWLLDGTPRPSSGRVTFTTWKHYRADSPLPESGLLGPVTIVSGRRARVD